MIRLLWLLAWTQALETRRWNVRIDEEIPVGQTIVNLREKLNYSPERIFSLMSSSELFALQPDGILKAKGRIDFESICVNNRKVCTIELEVRDASFYFQKPLLLYWAWLSKGAIQ